METPWKPIQANKGRSFGEVNEAIAAVEDGRVPARIVLGRRPS